MQPEQHNEETKPENPQVGVVYTPSDTTQTVEAQPVSQINSSDQSIQNDVPTQTNNLNNDEENSDNLFSWESPEYVSHHKSSSWFMILALLTVVSSIAVFFLTKDFISTAMVVLIGVAFGVFASRKPRVLDYSIGEDGVTIGQKLFQFEEFKSFSATEEGEIFSAVLLPLKRFMPQVNLCYSPSDDDRIIDLLSNYLPYEEHKRDLLDRAMRKIRF